MSPWNVQTDSFLIRRMGKTGEECAELSAVTSRIIIQGMDEIDPTSGRFNSNRLVDEMADVLAQIECNIKAFGLNREFIAQKVAEKIAQMDEWEEVLKKG